MKRRKIAAVAAAPLLTTSILAVSGSPAHAEPEFAGCSHSWSNLDPTAGHLEEAAHMRVGPHSNCIAATYEYRGTKLYYHCFVVNEAGNTWTHARAEGDSGGFWIWDHHLTDGGSLYQC